MGGILLGAPGLLIANRVPPVGFTPQPSIDKIDFDGNTEKHYRCLVPCGINRHRYDNADSRVIHWQVCDDIISLLGDI